MQTLTAAVQHYLKEVLGIDAPGPKPWARAQELPYFLREAFHFSEIDVLGQIVVLAIGRADAKNSLSEVRTWIDKVKVLAGEPVAYVTDALASYDRRRLIQQKVSFIVPGNQLYLPDLGLDLREYFRKRSAPAPSALSPSAQSILISALLRQPWQCEWQPSKVAATLGYTPMTLSRAVKELTATGLATAYMVGRSQWLRMELPPQRVWEHAKSVLRSPVRRKVWVADNGVAAQWSSRIAGLSALARCSMLSEPQWPVRAITTIDWKTAMDAGAIELPEPEAGALEMQLWNYSPALMPDSITVDPLSLLLSLQENTDDRIQLALDELKGQLPW